MDAKKFAKLIADGIEGDYPAAAVEAYIDRNPTVVRVEATDNDGVIWKFRLTVEAEA